MLTLLNRKELMTDTSMEELSRVKEALKKQNIPYEIKTQRSRGSIGMGMDVSAYRSMNMAYSADKQHVEYVYRLYVSRRNYSRAYSAAYAGE